MKLSSEAAEAIALTPVVVRELPVRELIEHMLGVTGKDEARIREILLRGALVSGASRFRWVGWEVETVGLRDLLATFPDPDPARVFAAHRCIRATLRGGRQAIEISRDTGTRKGMFQRKAFWDHLMEAAGNSGHVYAGYSYRDRADRYTRELAPAEIERLRAASDAVRYTTLRDQIRAAAFGSLELLATRE